MPTIGRLARAPRTRLAWPQLYPLRPTTPKRLFKHTGVLLVRSWHPLIGQADFLLRWAHHFRLNSEIFRRASALMRRPRRTVATWVLFGLPRLGALTSRALMAR